MLEPQQILEERYQLQRPLGRTATGRQTWLAIDLLTETQVIVKLLAFNPQMQWDEMKLFEREAQVLKSLNHPRIPHYRNSFSIDERVLWFGLVQQYIPGSSLQELLDQGATFSESEVRQLAVNVLHILTYLHESDPPVLHRDIKPSNLILGEDGYTYLVDFGAVQDRAAITGVTFTVVGTCGYAPLEQFWGRAVAASDLYALGATLIHLLTGTPPADLPQRNSRIQFADAVSLRPFFNAWLEKLTEPAIEKRFATARAALEALESGVVLTTPHQPLIRKILQPEKSRIQLNQSPDELTIYIPPHQFWQRVEHGLNITFLLLFSLGFVAAHLFPPLLAFSSPIVNLSLLAWGAIVFYGILLLVNEQTHISLNCARFQLIRRSLGITWVKREEPIANILGIFLQRNKNRLDVIVRADKRTYDFRSGLSELECIWLVQEIQNWLNGR
jgi:serine/threonine protein kinase